MLFQEIFYSVPGPVLDRILRNLTVGDKKNGKARLFRFCHVRTVFRHAASRISAGGQEEHRREKENSKEDPPDRTPVFFS